jgi:peptidyl-tRNA hydrolase
MDPADFVLHDFDPPQQELLPQVLDRAVQAMRTFVLEGIEPAMTMFNERPNKDADPGEDQD